MESHTKVFIIKSSNDEIILKSGDILEMELKLNISPWGKSHQNLGDALYYYYVGQTTNNIFFVDSDIIYHLKFLNTISYNTYKAQVYASQMQ